MADRYVPEYDHSADPGMALLKEGSSYDQVNSQELLSDLKHMGVSNIGSGKEPEVISPEDARQRRATAAESISRDYRILRDILNRHHATIAKRWQKKTKEQRRKVLLPAWNGDNDDLMPIFHRPDFDAYRRETLEQRENGTKYRSAFIWPYVNQEDLAKPRVLMLLLESRAKHEPNEFAGSDGAQMKFGIACSALLPYALEEHVMMFRNRTDPRDYGELIHFEDDSNASSWLKSGGGFNPGEGLLVLEAQQKLMTFLVECTKGVLHEIPEKELLDQLIQPYAATAPEGDIGFASLAVLRTEAPYRAPSQLDFERIAELMAARCNAAEDHLWALREDPGYYASFVKDCRDHRQEMLRDFYEDRHPVFYGHENLLWGRAIWDTVYGAYSAVEAYTSLHRQAVQLQDLQAKYAPQLSAFEELPEDYLYEILLFKRLLWVETEEPINLIKMSFVASPPMWPYYTRVPTDMLGEKGLRATRRRGLKLDKTEQQLIWMLRTVIIDDAMTDLIGLPNLMDELQRLLDTDAKARSLVSSRMAGVVGDLSIISECQRQLAIYQPWASTFEALAPPFEQKMSDTVREYYEPSFTMLELLADDDDKNSRPLLARYGTPTEGRFNYPVDKRRTKENSDIMRRSEANLDAFWKAIDHRMLTGAKDMLPKSNSGKLIARSRILQRTPVWVEPAQEEKGRQKSASDTLAMPLSEMYFDLQHRTERTVQKGQALTREPKTKPKTRGEAPVASTDESVYNNQVLGSNDADPQPTFAVDARALKVFRTLFYTPSSGATPGEVPWQDLLHAMVSTGFRAEKLYGSVWLFSPTMLDVERSIQMHEPHPGGKIPYTIARRHGRRLNRAYGWFGDMFVLAEKPAKSQESK